jgi:hypothetical protein
LMQLSRSSVFELRLATRGRAIHLAQIGPGSEVWVFPAFGAKRTSADCWTVAHRPVSRLAIIAPATSYLRAAQVGAGRRGLNYLMQFFDWQAFIQTDFRPESPPGHLLSHSVLHMAVHLAVFPESCASALEPINKVPNSIATVTEAKAKPRRFRVMAHSLIASREK